MKIPDTIYLQWYDEEEEKPIDINTGDVTWCIDRINNSDAEYVLINRYRKLQKYNAQLLEALEDMYIEFGSYYPYGLSTSVDLTRLVLARSHKKGDQPNEENT